LGEKIMAAAAALPIIGGTVSAIGTQQAANAKAQADMYNANIASQNATYTEEQTAEQIRRQQVAAGQTIGQERASYGASGVESNSGSALDVLQASAKNAALDSLTIQHAGDMKAWAYQSGAALDSMGATEAQIAGTYGVVSSGLGAGTGAANAVMGSS
jgi:hypothetical protein